MMDADKPYARDICGKSFKQKNHLTRHKNHTNVKFVKQITATVLP